jgi:beta-lactamase regulating signal transducer with metallopeptidase domain
MSLLLEFAKYYLLVQVLVCTAYLVLKTLKKALLWRQIHVSAAFWRSAHHLLLLSVIVMPVLSNYVSNPKVFSPPVQVWSSVGQGSSQPLSPEKFLISFTHEADKETLLKTTSAVVTGFIAFLFTVFVVAGGYFGFLCGDLLKLRRTLKNSLKIRSCGHLEIFLVKSLAVPFAAAFGKKAVVCLPEYLLSQPKNLKLTLAHEFQHLRQHDVAWVYVWKS